MSGKGFFDKKSAISLVSALFFLSAVLVPTGGYCQTGEKLLIEKRVLKQTTESNWPAGAWILESIGAVIAGAGFVVIGLGYAEIAQRDDFYSRFKRGEEIKARTIKDYEERGIKLSTAGWVAVSVGGLAMLSGALWLLFNRMGGEQSHREKVDSISLQKNR